MVADNRELIVTFTQFLSQITGTMYELLCIPEDDWYKLRESFIKENQLETKNESSNEGDESAISQSEQPFIDDVQEMMSEIH